jgi:methylmalonyl-CoA mutase C-terminal domain/subunit
VARALRDAGYEVIYTGIRQKVGVIAELALQEDVDLVGLSVLSGAHLGLARQVLEALRGNGLDDVKVVMGGTIPASDCRALLDLGIDAVFPTGTSIEDVVAGVDALWKEDDVVSA